MSPILTLSSFSNVVSFVRVSSSLRLSPHSLSYVSKEYVQVKPILAVVTLILKVTGSYNEGDFRANSGYLYVSVVYNFSICLSLYCLAMFWVVVNDDLQPFRPLPKFLCIKVCVLPKLSYRASNNDSLRQGIIFFSFWQSAGISVLVAANVIKKIGPYTDSEHISLALTDTLICFEMVLFAVAHQYAFSHTDYIELRLTYVARMPFWYAFRDSIGMLDVVEDTKATFAGEGMDYKEFEPAEGIMHQGSGRDRRIKAGLRYAEGGKKKYWLPMPAHDADPLNRSNRASNAIHRNHNEEVYAPLLEDQARDVVHDLSSDEDEFPTSHPSDGFSLFFKSPNNSDQDLYSQSKHYLFGDYNYPNVDVSEESARRRIWDEEERILRDERGAFFSPRHEARRVYFAQKTYGTKLTPSRSRERADSISSAASGSRHKGKQKDCETRGRERGQDDRHLTVNREDERLPDMHVDGVKLKWTRRGDLQPSTVASSPKSSSHFPDNQIESFRIAGSSRSNSESGSSSAAHSTPGSPQQRRRKISLPSDAVDLIVEDSKASEELLSRERKHGEPAVRGSGLRKVYRNDYHIEDTYGHNKEVDVEELRNPQTAEQDRLRKKIPEETTVIIRDKSTARERESQSWAREEETHADEVTRLQISRKVTPPPGARIQIDQYVEDENNPWA
jgi:Organic solute transporter Ostalpha